MKLYLNILNLILVTCPVIVNAQDTNTKAIFNHSSKEELLKDFNSSTIEFLVIAKEDISEKIELSASYYTNHFVIEMVSSPGKKEFNIKVSFNSNDPFSRKVLHRFFLQAEIFEVNFNNSLVPVNDFFAEHIDY